TRLAKTGLIERETHDADRRRSVLRLSANGLAVYDQVVPLTLDYERDLLAGFSTEERAILDRLLTRLDLASRPKSEERTARMQPRDMSPRGVTRHVVGRMRAGRTHSQPRSALPIRSSCISLRTSGEITITLTPTPIATQPICEYTS